jgi:hypothetical protein
MGIFSDENPPPKRTRKEKRDKEPRVPVQTHLSEENGKEASCGIDQGRISISWITRQALPYSKALSDDRTRAG